MQPCVLQGVHVFVGCNGGELPCISYVRSCHHRRQVYFRGNPPSIQQVRYYDIIYDYKVIAVTIFSKPQFTGQYLNFQSYCSKRRKIGLLNTLFHRAKKKCFSEVLENELNVIKEMLIKNRYPNPLIDRVLKL